MIKGWKLNPEWVRLMDEKKKALAQRKMAGKIYWVESQEDRDQAAALRAKVRDKLGLMLRGDFCI